VLLVRWGGIAAACWTHFLTSQRREGVNLAPMQVMGVHPTYECLAHGSTCPPLVVWVPHVTWAVVCHPCHPVTLSLRKASGAASVRWPGSCPCWLPRHLMPGASPSRLGISAFLTRSPWEGVCREPSCKSIVWGCSSSLWAHVFGTRACAGTRLSHHAARGQAPGVRRESGRGSSFRIFRCCLIFIQVLGFG